MAFTVFNNKVLGSHYVVKERPPYKKNFDDRDICIIANIRVDEESSRRLYTPSFTVNDTYLQDQKTVQLVADVQAGKKFNSTDFRSFDFGGAKLDNADFVFSTFDNTNMIGVKMKGAKLKGASFKGADLRGADLSNADLEGADLSFCNLEGAKLDGANLSGTDVDGAFFKATKLTNIKVDKKTLTEIEELLKMMEDLANGVINIKDVPKEWLSFIDLSKLDLNGMDLTGIDLRSLHTIGVDLSSANLSPDQVDGSYMFKSGAANGDQIVKIAKGNTAGLDLTSANLINEEIENEKRKTHLRRMVRDNAKEEALEIIEKQKTFKTKSDYFKKAPPPKNINPPKEIKFFDLEEKILQIDKNKLINPVSEYEFPIERRMMIDLEKVINKEFLSDFKDSELIKEMQEKEKQRELDLTEDRERAHHQQLRSEKRKAREQQEREEFEREELDKLASSFSENEPDDKKENEDDMDLSNIVSKKTRQHLKVNIRGPLQRNKG